MLHIPPTKKTHILTAPKNTPKTRATQEPFGKWKFQGKRSQKNGPKAKKGKTERATGLGRKTKEDISGGGIFQFLADFR